MSTSTQRPWVSFKEAKEKIGMPEILEAFGILDRFRVDRRGRHSREGYSSEQVLHEILLTEFLLAVWQTVQGRPDLELLTIQWRSLAKHPAFQVSLGGRVPQLKAEALFLFRQQAGGMMCCCVKLDTGTINRKQLRVKFKRYQAWAQSEAGRQYLLDLYRRYGASDARPVFRILVVAKSRAGSEDESRMGQLLTAAVDFSTIRLWITSVAGFRRVRVIRCLWEQRCGGAVGMLGR